MSPESDDTRPEDATAVHADALEVESLDALEVRARAMLERSVYDFIAGGAGAELTLRANRAAFDAVRLMPRAMSPVGAVDPSTTILGTRASMPVFVSPMSAHGLVHPSAEVGTAAGCASVGTIFIAPTFSNCSLAEMAAAQPPGPRWFQLYPRKDAGVTRELLRSAEASGYTAIVLTVDQATNGLRERDRRHHFVFPPHLRFPNLAAPGAPPVRDVTSAASEAQHDITWDDYETWRRETRLPLVVKGILSPEAAEEAAWREVPAIIVSNHGGRQLDSGLASLDALPDIVERVRGRTMLLLDGGVRRGVDVVKAIALGAHAVGIGRPALWALAVGGADGVRAMLEHLRSEITNVMTLLGTPQVRDITPDQLR